MIKIPQKHYGDLEIHTREKDVIEIFENKEHSTISIERENIPALIDVLAKEIPEPFYCSINSVSVNKCNKQCEQCCIIKNNY